MKSFRTFLNTVLIGSLLLILTVIQASAAEIDDSALFVEAFTAYQNNDYLLAIDKIKTLNDVFPDTPLRDVTLLLLARSGMKAGENELAAKTINQFNKEFTSTPLTSTIEDELQNLGTRLGKGEKLKQNKALYAAAQKKRNEQIAIEKAAVLKIEQERLAKEKAEQARIAMAKAETERKERERIAAEKAEKASIKTAITLVQEGRTVVAGQKSSLPFEIANLGAKQEMFTIEAGGSQDYNMTFYSAENMTQPVTTVSIEPKQTFKGTLSFQMPPDKVDGHKIKIPLRVISTRYKDVEQSSELQLIAAAPLIRVVAKPAKTALSPGELTRYKITVLNLGSQPAGKLTARVVLPTQFDFVDAPGVTYRQEAAGVFVLMVDSLASGKLSEFNFNLKVREDSTVGQKIQGQVEIIDNKFLHKQSFSSVAAVVQKK